MAGKPATRPARRMTPLMALRIALRVATGIVLTACLAFGFAQAGSANTATPAYIYVSSSSSGTVDSVTFGSEDILRYDTVTDTWEMFFDASEVGLGAGNVDGFSVVNSGPTTEIVLSLAGPLAIAGLGTVDDSDTIVFTGTSGPATSGTLARLLDGTDIGLTAGGEDVDAIALNGTDYLLSTLGSANVPGDGGGALIGRDEDLLSLAATSTGDPTAGTFTMFYDGSDVGLGVEDIDGAWIDQATGAVYFSVTNAYNVGGVSGDAGDIIAFTGATGEATSGTFSLFFDDDAHRFGGENIDGLDIEFQAPTASGQADLSITKGDDADPVAAGDTVTYTIDVANIGPDEAANVVVTDVLPAGVTLVSTTGCLQDPNGLPCSLGTIAAGQSASYTMAVTVDAGVQGSLTNLASVTSSTADPDPADNSTSEETYVGVAPAAVDDGPATNSTPGDPFHTAVDTTLTAADGSTEDLLNNDEIGDPAAAVVSFGGVLGGVGFTSTAGTTHYFGTTGRLTVNAGGSFSFTPDAGFEGSVSFDYEIENALGSAEGTVTIFIGNRPAAMSGDLVYLSTTSAGVVDDLAYGSEDILVYDLGQDSWSLYFNGSDLGLGAANIDGFAIINNPSADEVLFSLTAPTTLAGLGRIDDSDILRFVGTAGDPTTATTLELYVDASDLRLTAGGEDIDAVTEFGSGLAVSTIGSFSARRVNGLTLSGSDEDLSAMVLTTTGPTTSGGLERLFDGSAVDLTGEDLTSAWHNSTDDTIFATSLNGFSVPGLTGDSNDVFVFAGSTGANTSGTFSVFFDADAARLTGKSVDGLHIALRGAPTIISDGGGSTAAISVPENTTAVTDVNSTDDDTEGAGLTYSLTTNTNGADNALFTLDPNTGLLGFTTAPDHEDPTDTNGNNDYEVEVTVTDSGGLTDTQNITVTITDVTEDVDIEVSTNGDDADTQLGPIINVGEPVEWSYEVTNLGTTTLENLDISDSQLGPVCTIASLPAGSSDTCTVPGTADPGQYANTGTVDATPVGATSSVGDSDPSHYFGNTAPTIVGGDTAEVSLTENSTVAADLAADDDLDSDGSGLTYSFTTDIGGADNAHFNMNATGLLVFDTAPDFENPGDADANNDYEIEVTVTDSNGLSDTQNITVTVNDVIEAFVLSPGDVVIIGGHSPDPNDEVSWVPLVDLPAGIELYFSDAAYHSAAGSWQGGGRTEEWLVRFTVPAGGISAGTVQTFADGTSPAGYDQPGVTTRFGARGPSGGLLDISMVGFGEEIVVFHSTDDPTTSTFGQTDFTALFHIDSGSGNRELFTFDGTAITHTTDLAPGLTVGLNAVGLRNEAAPPPDPNGIDEWDNIRYTGTRTGTKAELLAAIANNTNWEGTDLDQGSGWSNAGGNFTVS